MEKEGKKEETKCLGLPIFYDLLVLISELL